MSKVKENTDYFNTSQSRPHIKIFIIKMVPFNPKLSKTEILPQYLMTFLLPTFSN